MDPAKVKAVAEGPIPEKHKRFQQFPGFANFYCRFIRKFSAIAAPLQPLTSTKAQFRWSEAANKAFKQLKSLFVSAPILIVP